MAKRTLLSPSLFLTFPLLLAAFTAGGCQIIAGLGGEEPLASGGSGGSGGSGATGATGGNTGGTGGTGGMSGPCTPPDTQTCYSGPAGTKDVGVCVGGVSTCSPEGMWGPCEGEVLPSTETCANPADEDCSGYDCSVWVKAILGDVYGETVAIDVSGNVYVGLYVSAGVDVGDGDPVVPQGNTDVAVVKYDKDGNFVWKYVLGAPSEVTINDISVDASGNAVFCGGTSASTDFGNGAIAAGAYVAKLNSSGQIAWAVTGTGVGAAPPSTSHVAINSQGDVYAAGSAMGIDFGSGVLQGGTDPISFFLVKLKGASGQVDWVKMTKSNYEENINGLTVDASDSAVFAGTFRGAYLNLGGPGSSPNDISNSSNQLAPYIARVPPGGAQAEGKVLAANNPLTADVTGIGVDKFGEATVVGGFSGYIQFQSGNYTAGSNYVAFMVHDQVTSFNQWSQAFPVMDGYAGFNKVGVDSADNIVVSGQYGGTPNFGGGALPMTASGFVVKFDKTGNHLWSRSFDFEDGNFSDMAVGGPDDSTVLVGTFYGSANLGTGTIQADQGAFIVKLAK
ncbi:MAG: hypothetical protein IPK82_28215 [Polyangiaceae bacterium]|nr:hypothetical protein [Polyangiaceae bacterium]